jgi:hypothetical protein
MRNILIAAACMLGACNYTDKKTTTDAPAENAGKNKRSVECYTYQVNRDTVYLRLDIDGTKARGDLRYMLFEKDRNNGTINGEMKGDTLFAEYTFNAEGTKSVREVAFLKKGDRFVEGYGDVEEKNGQMVFKDRSRISFGTMVLAKTECAGQ